jgi:hypothetical protein
MTGPSSTLGAGVPTPESGEVIAPVRRASREPADHPRVGGTTAETFQGVRRSGAPPFGGETGDEAAPQQPVGGTTPLGGKDENASGPASGTPPACGGRTRHRLTDLSDLAEQPRDAGGNDTTGDSAPCSSGAPPNRGGERLGRRLSRRSSRGTPPCAGERQRLARATTHPTPGHPPVRGTDGEDCRRRAWGVGTPPVRGGTTGGGAGS